MQNIIVAFAKPEDNENFRRLLGRKGLQVSMVCNSGSQALFAMENLGSGVILCGYRQKDMLFSELAENMPPHFQMLLVASQGRVDQPLPEQVVYLPTPLRTGDLFASLDLMLERVSPRRRKKDRPIHHRSEEEERLLREAKEVLMDRHQMTESEAHRYLQRRSMESGNSITETAEMVLLLNA